jgi:hypothetical protein
MAFAFVVLVSAIQIRWSGARWRRRWLLLDAHVSAPSSDDEDDAAVNVDLSNRDRIFARGTILLP